MSRNSISVHKLVLVEDINSNQPFTMNTLSELSAKKQENFKTASRIRVCTMTNSRTGSCYS